MFNILEKVYDKSGMTSEERLETRFPSVGAVFGFVANFVLAVAMGVSVAGLAYSFVLLVLSAGDEKSVKKAYQGVLYSTIGIFISLVAFTLRRVLINTAGIDTPDLVNDVPTSF